MKSTLANKTCAPCDGKTPRLDSAGINRLLRELDGHWNVVNEHHLEKKFKFKDFRETLEFVNRVAEAADDLGHHPDICFTYGEATLTIWTHANDGLTENDFILAAKVDEAA